MVSLVLDLTLQQPTGQSSILRLNSEVVLNCFASQSLQDPSSHQTYIKALAGDQTKKRSWPPFSLTLAAASPLAEG